MAFTAPRTAWAPDLSIRVGDARLDAVLRIPPGAPGIVVTAHGSGSGRLGPRNLVVADALADAGLGTVLMDLLSPDEEAEDRRTGRLRFDIPLLAERLIGAIDWLSAGAAVGDLPPRAGELPVGLYGAGTGAAAALIAAAERPDRVAAVVSRGGRTDFARDVLPRLRAATLLIVGARDPVVLRLNRETAVAVGDLARLEIVPGVGHLYEEPGALARVVALTREWFETHLGSARRAAR